MAITPLHVGAIGQIEFAKLVAMGSDGRLEVMLPMSDDEQRDAEVHHKNRFASSLAIQIKVSARLHGDADNPVLHVSFRVRKERLINHAAFWYFVAYLDEEMMQLGPNCFLIPSATFHERALRLDFGKHWEYHLTTTLAASATDQWTGYRVEREAVGSRLIAIIDGLWRPPANETSTGLSSVQKGVISVSEFAKLVMLGSYGQLEASLPVMKDDNRDIEVHQHGQFDMGVSFQVHAAMGLVRDHLRDRLVVRFQIPHDRVRSDHRFWYFFAHLEREEMRFGNPCFVVPSQEVHRRAYPHRYKRFMYFMFQASMAAASADRWTPYRVEPLKVGQRVLEIVRNSARPDAPRRELKAS
jgi:hypothetical protein